MKTMRQHMKVDRTEELKTYINLLSEMNRVNPRSDISKRIRLSEVELAERIESERLSPKAKVFRADPRSRQLIVADLHESGFMARSTPVGDCLFNTVGFDDSEFDVKYEKLDKLMKEYESTVPAEKRSATVIYFWLWDASEVKAVLWLK